MDSWPACLPARGCSVLMCATTHCPIAALHRHLHPPLLSNPPPPQHLSGLELYFAMARGAPGAPALDMSKLLDTNYHYLVGGTRRMHACTRERVRVRMRVCHQIDVALPTCLCPLAWHVPPDAALLHLGFSRLPLLPFMSVPPSRTDAAPSPPSAPPPGARAGPGLHPPPGLLLPLGPPRQGPGAAGQGRRRPHAGACARWSHLQPRVRRPPATHPAKGDCAHCRLPACS